MTAQQKATDLLALLKQKEIAEERVKTYSKGIFKLQGELVDAMMEEGVTAIEIEGLKFSTKPDFNHSMQNTEAKKWAECPEFLQFLEQENDLGMVKQTPTIHAGTLKKWVKDRMAEGKSLPDCMKITHYTKVDFNKSAVKRMALGAGKD